LIKNLKEYRKKISREEENQGKILILKNDLKKFPPIGELFDLKFGKTISKAKIISTRCSCVGPDKPHEHYYLESEAIMKALKGRVGKFALITEETKGSYSLKISNK